MQPNISRRERKKQETRQRLLEASMSLFREKGYNATTVEEITERADVAKGTFFNYFDSKEALLGELEIWGLEKLRAALDVNNGAPRSPVARIKLLVRLLHERIGDGRRLHRRVIKIHMTTPPSPEEARRPVGELLTGLVREAQACGELRADLDPELVSSLLHVSYIGQILVCKEADKGLPPVAYFEQIIDLWMDGLAGPEWS